MRDERIDYGASPKPGEGQASAMFGAGCFWGVEQRFRALPGVIDAEVGYAGGRTDRPTYKQVCDEDTNHAEVVRLIFDPRTIGYDELLRAFFEMHNPTTRNRQGPDVGSQYRSVVFYFDESQRSAAEAAKRALRASGRWGDLEIVTEISPAPEFYRAEAYHQQYNAKHGRSCSI